jgi:hypothetical protein
VPAGARPPVKLALFGVASGTEGDAVTDDRTGNKRDPEPAQEYDSNERCPAHACIIGPDHGLLIGRKGYFWGP